MTTNGTAHRGAVLRSAARAGLRHAALDVLSSQWKVRGKIEEYLARPRIALPYLHAVPASREHEFRELLRVVSRTHELIGYDEAIRRLRDGPIDRPYMSFSFDDGFKSNVRTAAILEEFGATGCFFVPTSFIGTPSVSEARSFFGYADGVDEPAMTWGDLESLKSRGHMVENHTRSHRVLSWISENQSEDEIAGSADVLRSRLGSARHFAWPRGRFFHFNDKAARLVFKSGHATCASAERGAHVSRHLGRRESLCVRRDHVMAEWPLRHTLYFLAASSARATPASNDWPKGWVTRDGEAATAVGEDGS